MSSRSLPFLLAVLALGGGSDSARAQANPIVGTWTVSYAGGTRVENGVATTLTATGKLVVQLEGDSLVARLIPDPIEGRSRPEARMVAPGGAGTAVFVQRGTARVNINGEEKEVATISTWTLTAKGDALDGTVERRLEGMDTPTRGPQPVTGTRVKAR